MTHHSSLLHCFIASFSASSFTSFVAFIINFNHFHGQKHNSSGKINRNKYQLQNIISVHYIYKWQHEINNYSQTKILHTCRSVRWFLSAWFVGRSKDEVRRNVCFLDRFGAATLANHPRRKRAHEKKIKHQVNNL